MNSSKVLSPIVFPCSTADFAGTGGRIERPCGFVVQEIPAYLPTGQGEHCFVEVEKRELTTPQAIDLICREFSLNVKDVGSAGLKDKWAITRQWLSFCGADPEKLRGFEHPNLRVLQAGLHGNKLRTGHLRGNRFIIEISGAKEGGLGRAQKILSFLSDTGLPNFFGPQRFGAFGDNGQRGISLVLGKEKGPKNKRIRRLLVSAAQSLLFNQVLAIRMEQNKMKTLLGGEVVQFVGKSASFVSEDSEADQERIDAGELVITGPICGPRMLSPKTSSPAEELEIEVFAQHGVNPKQFGNVGRIGRGGRRPCLVPMINASVESVATSSTEPSQTSESGQKSRKPDELKSKLTDERLRIGFTLPPGSYATVVLAEVMKNEGYLRTNP